MRMTKQIGALVGISSLVLGMACKDLDVTNPNNPDIDRALATPEDVKNIAISSVNTWYIASTYMEPYLMMAVTADALTANFGNFGMRFNNQEPRTPYGNSSTGTDRAVTEQPWKRNYQALGAANDALRAFDAGIKAPGAASETEKYRSLAMFSQAAALTNLALIFDKAFIVDEKLKSGELPELKSYKDVSAAALAKWDALIALTSGKSHTYDASVLPLQGGALNSAKLNRIANTMAARLLAYTPRNKADGDAANWAKILQYAEKGISGPSGAGSPFDMTIMGDGNNWYSEWMMYADLESWLRIDFRIIQRFDPTQPAKMTSVTLPPKATSADKRLDTDFTYQNGTIGDPARGVHMLSPWSHSRYLEHSWDGPEPGVGPAPYILAAENDLLIAEALARTGGDLARAATLINKTRVGRGNLAPATAADGKDKLLAYIQYEQDIELLNTGGIELFNRRRIDGVQAGTVRHLPVPASELETLRLPIYTFGGAGQPDMTVLLSLDGGQYLQLQLPQKRTGPTLRAIQR